MPESQTIVLFGPPGCGKTTTLAESAKKAITRYQNKRALVIVSLTNAAAHEIASRNIPVASEQVGTLHALCYRQLGRPPIAETRLEDWNKTQPGYQMAVKKKDKKSSNPEMDTNTDGAGNGALPGDERMAGYDLLRHRMVSREVWPASIRAFAHAWEAWKEENDCIDFTDMIELVLHDCDGPPFDAPLLMGDEIQDCSKLEYTILHKWAAKTHFTMLAGDDLQAVYTFRGADPMSLINMDPPPRERRVLSQSYRLPRQVHAYCEQWGDQVSEQYPKLFLPRDEEGQVSFCAASWESPRPLLALYEAAERENKTLMVLAACQYQLRPTLAVLRQAGVPFHNLYRKAQGEWNPLLPRKNMTSSADRLSAFLAPSEADRLLWTRGELHAWLPLLTTEGCLQRGAKRLVKEWDADPSRLREIVSVEQLRSLFLPGVAEEALAGDPYWLANRCVSASKRALLYPAAIAEHRGMAALQHTPRVTVGTVHSVKGGEADWVAIYPDLSFAGYEEWMGQPREHDTVLRQFYVGLSRARERLYLCQPSSPRAVQWLPVA